jgi:hypothetical protein
MTPAVFVTSAAPYRHVIRTWVLLLLLAQPLFTLGCGWGAEPPPHPPPDPKLDIVVVGTNLQINGQLLNVTNITPAQITSALGAPPLSTDDWLYFQTLGVSVALKEGRLITLNVLFTPYGLAEDRGMAGFEGRFLVNGAWIHRDAEIYHIEKELGRPCNRGNQGIGGFDKSPFPDSWDCEVGGQPFAYWMKRHYHEEHPVFAFEVVFYEQPFPPQPTLPELSWSDVVRLPFDLIKIGIGIVKSVMERLKQ